MKLLHCHLVAIPFGIWLWGSFFGFKVVVFYYWVDFNKDGLYLLNSFVIWEKFFVCLNFFVWLQHIRLLYSSIFFIISFVFFFIVHGFVRIRDCCHSNRSQTFLCFLSSQFILSHKEISNYIFFISLFL